MQFVKEKSQLSAFQKTEFEDNSTLYTNVIKIPGVGPKTKEVLKEQKIETIKDLVDNICSDFNKLCLITPSQGVNNHKIYDALETYLPFGQQKKVVNHTEEEDTYNLEQLQKIDTCCTQ